MQMKHVEAAHRAVRYGVNRDGRGVPGIVAGLTGARTPAKVVAAGVRSLESGVAMSEDTVFALYSCTKAVAAVAALQCVEEGLLDLDTPAREFVPSIADIQVLEGMDEQNNPIVRPPKREITVRMLLLHTAGFGYEFFNPLLAQYARGGHAPPPRDRSANMMKWPLTFDPGERWQYGLSMDWCGLVIEAIRGKRLGNVLRERVFAPLDMHDTGFYLTPSMASRLASLHLRKRDGTLSPKPAGGITSEPQVDFAGGGLYGTVPDFLRFIRMWLNGGAGTHGRVLWPQTVEFALRNGLKSGSRIANFPQVNPFTSRSIDLFSGHDKSWGYSFLINEQPSHSGRSAGSAGWGGLANLYYWIDPHRKFGGMWAAQVLPFGDTQSFNAYAAFEASAYGRKPPLLEGSNREL